MLQTMNPITNVALKLRPGTPADAEICGQICFDAFKTISEQHNFPPDFPDPAMLQGLRTVPRREREILRQYHRTMLTLLDQVDGAATD